MLKNGVQRGKVGLSMDITTPPPKKRIFVLVLGDSMMEKHFVLET